MNKGIMRHTRIYCRKWIVIWTILILILSFISLSAGSGNETENRKITGTDSRTVTDKDSQSGENTEESTVEDLEAKEETETGTDDQKTGSEIHENNIHEKNSKALVSTDDQESTGETQKTASDSDESTDNQEDTNENLKAKEEIEDSKETVAEKDTSSQESLEESKEMETETEPDTDNWENFEENLEVKKEKGCSIDAQKSSRDNLVATEKEQDTDDWGSTEENDEVQTGGKDDIISSGSTEENSEPEVNTEKGIDDQENSKKSNVAGKTECCSTDDLKSSCKSTLKEEKKGENSRSIENLAVNLRLKACETNEKDTSECSGTENEMNSEPCDGSKNPEVVEVKIEGEASNGETNQINDDLKTQNNIEESNVSYITEINEAKPYNSGKSSWYNLQYILSHTDTLRLFYNTHQSVKISYNGPEYLKEKKVYIYLIKTRIPSFSDEAAKNITAGTISFEDIVSKNLESYIQIPGTLNEYGDLSPLTLGPLPEGSYWVAVTFAENKMKASEPGKTILMAQYFKVMEYEIEAEAPSTIGKGENFEVNLRMKNALSQKNYTYCAVLVREDACKTNMNISSDNGTKPMSGTLVQRIMFIEDLGSKSTNFESQTGKDKLKNEIQTLIGEGNGTINIGDENKNKLSLTTSDLPSGNYLLFVSSYEKCKGLTCMTQKEVAIL
ncbi:hypothetical protein SDC9_95560 [bioreactor metagenome]|uniref:Uncharacterized protein n=1 Tax=bioreactor metagenome TaxID=1076179 RepID=A0A645ADB5_9ZZZZ